MTTQPSRDLPQNCILHDDKLDKLCGDMSEVKMAVCGDERLGIAGLVKSVAELQEWRKKIDLRVAGIAGGVSVVLFVAEYLFK